jgi:hypothetical protein
LKEGGTGVGAAPSLFVVQLGCIPMTLLYDAAARSIAAAALEFSTFSG